MRLERRRLVTAPARTLGRGAALVAPDGVPGVRTLVRSGLMQLFGPPVVDTSTPREDAGVLGAHAVSWRVLGEPAAIAGGVRGLLVQALHPLATAGVADHSAFRSDPLGRLARTSSWVTTSTFGTREQTRRSAARVRGAHRSVRGTAPDGRPYAADAPELLAWVQVALTSSFLVAHRLWAPHQLDRDEVDTFVVEQSRLAALLDRRIELAEVDLVALGAGALDDELPLLAEGHLPRDRASLDAILVRRAPQLGVEEQGRDVLDFLAHPPLPAFARAPYRTLLAGAAGSLPAEQRAMTGLLTSSTAADAGVAAAATLLVTMRTVNGTSPAWRAAREAAAA